jgi:hypothetical protein
MAGNTQMQDPATPKYSNVGAGAIKFLRSPLATLIVLCSALLAQLPHASDVFRLIVAGNGWPAILHGFTYALALELAVLLFVVQHRNVESYIFAAVSILVNLSYYYLHGVALLSVAALPAWLVSIALPAAIAQYSHLIVAATEQGEAQPATARTAAKTAKHRRWQFWRKPQEAATTSSSTTSTAQMPVALPVGILTAQNASTGASQPPAELPERAPASAPTLRVVDGASDADLATQLGVTRQAVAGMRKRGTLERNIAKRLPSLTPVHVNGNTNGHNAQ